MRSSFLLNLFRMRRGCGAGNANLIRESAVASSKRRLFPHVPTAQPMPAQRENERRTTRWFFMEVKENHVLKLS